ncbi:hypothetical protein ACVBGC_20795 [Burkholderia stagnalis]
MPARIVTTPSVVARRRRPRRTIAPGGAAPLARVGLAARFVDEGAGAIAAAAACAIATLATAIAPGRDTRTTRTASRPPADSRPARSPVTPAMPRPSRRRPFSSVRLTLMQDHSS